MTFDEFIKSPIAMTEGRSYKQILIDARALLADKSRWTQDAYARDAQGRITKPVDPAAVQWDILGAVARCSNRMGIAPIAIIQFLEDAVVDKEWGKYGFEQWCDYVRHEDTLAFLDDVIARLPD